MTKKIVGILHPGAMGVSIAASAKNTGHTVYWASEGRSPQTHERANKVGLLDIHSLSRLCDECSVIFSVCPPHASEDVAKAVIDHAFGGIYLDANAISPQRATRIGQAMADAGVEFVDGGIIGGPAWKPGGTRMYLSGKEAQKVAEVTNIGSGRLFLIGATGDRYYWRIGREGFCPEDVFRRVYKGNDSFAVRHTGNIRSSRGS
ncbi:NAD(P)-binding domain-containing protein [Candidatus Poribacteria bacterium]